MTCEKKDATRKDHQDLKFCLAYSEDAIKAQTKSNENKVRIISWRASFEMEYALFLLTLDNPEKN